MTPARILPVPVRALAAIALLASLTRPASAGTVYDLTADWSDSVDPNGVWSYREGGDPLPHVSAWQGLSGDFTSAQPAWARSAVGTSNLPCFFKSSADVGIVHDWLAGDVVCHTTGPFNGIGSGIANVTWTSPVTGTVAVTGAVWMGRDIGRGNHWSVALDGAALTSGDVYSGDPYSRAAPMDFASGSGGPAALSAVAVRAGDVIELDLSRTSAAGDYSGIRMQVELVQPTGVGDALSSPGLVLSPPVPNPIRGSAWLGYSIPRAGAVELALYDLNGRLVKVLESGDRPAGEHRVGWTATVPGAVYFLRLRCEGRQVIRRIVVVG